MNFMDLGPQYDQVDVGSGKVDCRGLSFGDVFDMANEFPEIKAMLEGKAAEVKPERFMLMSKPVLSRLGGFFLADPDADDIDTVRTKAGKWFLKQGMADQLKIIRAGLRMTFRGDHVGPFVAAMEEVKAMFSEPSQTPELASSQGTKPQSESSSPVILSASLVTDIPPINAGAVARARSQRGFPSAPTTAAPSTSTLPS